MTYQMLHSYFMTLYILMKYDNGIDTPHLQSSVDFII